MIKRRFMAAALAAALVLATLGGAGSSAAAPRRGDAAVSIDAVVEVLENGLKVILVQDRSVPVVSRYTFYRVGSRNETAGITGISHFIEHMMFNGAEKYGPKEFDRILESSGGYSNAFTSTDMTAYFEDIAADGLELVIDLDSDRMRSIAFDPKYVVSEMGVVKEERRMSIDNSIEGQMWEDLCALAFKAHPYGTPVIGWMSDLEGITREDCVEYFRTYYAPNNAILIIAGDFDPDEALGLVREYYGPIPAQDPPAPPRTAEPPQQGERRAELHMRAEMPAVLIAWRTVGVDSDEIYALDVLDKILSGGRSSRLYRRLVRGTEAAVSVSTSAPWRIDPFLFIVSVKMKPGRETAEAEETVYAVLEEIVSEGVAATELERAKNQLEADFVRGMQTVNGTAGRIGRFEILFGDFREIENVPRRYRAVTADEVRAVAERYLTAANRSVITLVPAGAEN